MFARKVKRDNPKTCLRPQLSLVQRDKNFDYMPPRVLEVHLPAVCKHLVLSEPQKLLYIRQDPTHSQSQLKKTCTSLTTPLTVACSLSTSCTLHRNLPRTDQL